MEGDLTAVGGRGDGPAGTRALSFLDVAWLDAAVRPGTVIEFDDGREGAGAVIGGEAGVAWGTLSLIFVGPAVA